MNYPIVDQPPKNEADYVLAKPNDIPEDYINNLAGLLKQGTLHIKTDVVAVGLVTEAINRAHTNSYSVTMQRVVVNGARPELGIAHGIFYFERRSKSEMKS